jgi:hypothetical protein
MADNPQKPDPIITLVMADGTEIDTPQSQASAAQAAWDAKYAGKTAATKATSLKATSFLDTNPVTQVYRGIKADPEGFIDQAAPAAGAGLGAAATTLMGAGPAAGAFGGALAGRGYAKLNRMTANAIKGRPVLKGLPSTVAEEGQGMLGDVALNAGPELVGRAVIPPLINGGRALIRKAISPNLSSVEHMSEMAKRGTLPVDVGNQIANTVHRESGAFWSPLSEGATRNLVNEGIKGAEANTAAVRAVGDAGGTVNVAPMIGDAGGRSLATARGDWTPSEILPSIRARLQSLMHDPESRLTVPYERWTEPRTPVSPDTRVMYELPGDGGALVRRAGDEGLGDTLGRPEKFSAVVPHPTANPSDVLTSIRKISANERANWGAKSSAQSATSGLNKNLYHAGSEALKETTPGLREGMGREHELMNAIEAIVRRSTQASNATPVNLYSAMGIVGNNPTALAMGVGRYPTIMAGVGHAAMTAGERLGGQRALGGEVGDFMQGALGRPATPLDFANMYRAAILAKMTANKAPQEP